MAGLFKTLLPLRRAAGLFSCNSRVGSLILGKEAIGRAPRQPAILTSVSLATGPDLTVPAPDAGHFRKAGVLHHLPQRDVPLFHERLEIAPQHRRALSGLRRKRLPRGAGVFRCAGGRVGAAAFFLRPSWPGRLRQAFPPGPGQPRPGRARLPARLQGPCRKARFRARA